MTFKSEPEEEAGKKSKLTCVSDFQIFIVLYFAFEVYTMNLSKSVVITIFHLFELLNAENIFLYICLWKLLRNNALCFSSHSQLSVVSKTLNKQFGYFQEWVFPKFKIILVLIIVCYLRHLVSILKVVYIYVRVCCCLHSLMVFLQGVLVFSSYSFLLLAF